MVEPVFPEEQDLAIKEELVSLHAINPFLNECSASRCHMASTHLSQAVVIENGDEKIIQTGLEKQLGDNTFSVKLEDDVKILSVIPRYTGLSIEQEVVDTLLLVETVDGMLDYYIVPTNFKLDTTFGFPYKHSKVMSSIRTGVTLPKGTILADSPTKTDTGGYRFGVNANLCLVNLQETAEDGIIISERLSKKMTYNAYEEKYIEVRDDELLLNLYGTKDDYKPFPEIGETINDDSVLVVLRKMDEDILPSILSANDLMSFDVMNDTAVYARSPGGVITDIKIYGGINYKKKLLSGTGKYIEKYINAYNNYYKSILTAYESIKKEYMAKYKTTEVNLSKRLKELLVEAMSIDLGNHKKVTYTYKNNPISKLILKFTIRYTLPVACNNKLSDFFGSKGVVVRVKPDNEMPYTEVDGERVIADIVMDPSSLVSRMNVGRLYEQYFNAISRKTQHILRKILPIDTKLWTQAMIDQAWDVLLGCYKLIGSEQYTEASLVTDNNLKIEVLYECITEEVYLLYRLVTKKRPYQVVLEAKGTIYEPSVSKLHIPTPNGIVTTKDDIMIAPVYSILLFKTGDTYLSVAGSKLNHFGFPVGVSSSTRDNLPYRSSPTKICSEAEQKLYLSYVSRNAIAEVKSRANNIDVHKTIYRNILNADTPTNIDSVYDRDTYGYEDDVAMELIHNIFNAAGIEIVDTKTNM